MDKNEPCAKVPYSGKATDLFHLVLPKWWFSSRLLFGGSEHKYATRFLPRSFQFCIFFASHSSVGPQGFSSHSWFVFNWIMSFWRRNVGERKLSIILVCFAFLRSRCFFVAKRYRICFGVFQTVWNGRNRGDTAKNGTLSNVFLTAICYRS